VKKVKGYTKFGQNFMTDWTPDEKKKLRGFSFKDLETEVK
jgi:hypothetical protein